MVDDWVKYDIVLRGQTESRIPIAKHNKYSPKSKCVSKKTKSFK